MSYHPRIESKKYASFITTRSRNSELWFVNNKRLENAVLGYLAKFSDRYNVRLYAFAIEGNHTHLPALFPEAKRSHFMRDLNSCIARAIPRYCETYPGGRFWERRFSSEVIARPEDIEEQFFYTVLQPVQDGLVEKISEYPGYNCFHDAVNGIRRKYTVVNWAKYNADSRYKAVNIKDYTEIVELHYTRLPGYEALSQKDYARLMRKKLEERRLEIVNARRQAGLGFVGRDKLSKVKPGSSPKNSKRSSRMDHRPRVLSGDDEARAECRAWYFGIYYQYQESSKRYRAGEWATKFPEGTYRPYCDSHPGNP